MFVHTNNGLHINKVTRHYIYADTPQYAIELWSKCVNELVEKNVSFLLKFYPPLIVIQEMTHSCFTVVKIKTKLKKY